MSDHDPGGRVRLKIPLDCSTFVMFGGGQLDGLIIGNTFAYRATDQREILNVDDPIGPENDKWLMAMAEDAALVVLAYGTPKHQELRTRGIQVAQMLRQFNPKILRLSKNNIPYHPLYLPESTEPEEWEIPV